MILRWS